MRLFHLVLIAGLILVVSTTDDKNRKKRQQITYFSRRGARPPPYAVQMEPIVQYSQRDPLYNPLVSSKSDDIIYQEDSLHNPYLSSEPEPIIEIIIKESNESLPTPAPPPLLPTSKPTKEPIQVFYVKYEKKDQGNGKSKVVYDKPIPALTPHEEHEEIKPESLSSPSTYEEELPTNHYVTPSPESTTTLRAIIRPDSEVYHSISSNIKISFGSEQLPPNSHNKRSDNETKTSNVQITNPPPITLSSISSSSSSSATSRRQHGPYAPIPYPNHHRLPPAYPQQRIVNSFPAQQQQQQQLPPSSFLPQPQFQSPSPITNSQRQQRPPISIQGLPEIQQRLPFQSFNVPHRISINHPQQPGFPPAVSVSHQSVHLQNQPPPQLHTTSFNSDKLNPHHQPQQQLQSYKQQEQEKQKYHEQRRQQELLKQREQLYRQQELQRQQQDLQNQERQRQQYEQQKRQQDSKIRQDQQYNLQNHFRQQQQVQQHGQQQQNHQQQHQNHQQQQKNQQQQQQNLYQHQHNQQQQVQNQYQHLLQQQQQQQNQQRDEPQKTTEIFKAVSKLEQHYAIRENPLHPGPFPPNAQLQSIQYPQTPQNNFQSRQQSNSVSLQPQTLLNNPENFGSKINQVNASPPPPTPSPKITNNNYNNQQPYYSPNSPPQLQRGSSQSLWGQLLYNKDTKSKIFATPVPTYQPSTQPPTTTTITTTTSTTTTTTPAPTSVAPKNEAKIQENIANLPDEVPEDIRNQLLSSGILGNADIQVLDYDKIGDIPIENLPPEALANFYGAGGGDVAASAPIPAIAKKPKISDDKFKYPKKVITTSISNKVEHATLRPGGVEMKVVRFDPNSSQGQAIADQHINEDATHLKPVTVGTKNDSQYNRYLPLKVSGTSFPIPDIPEFKNRKISSVVVLAPVDYNFNNAGNDNNDYINRSFNDYDSNDERQQQTRDDRKLTEPLAVKFLAGDSLRQLIKKPSAENYKKWLEQESRTEPQKQSVILLVTTPKYDTNGEKEIYMYDVTSQTVSKLSGDLSSAFVDAAESNADSPVDTINDSSFTR